MTQPLMAIMLVAGYLGLLLASSTFAQQLDLPIAEQSDGDLDTCLLAEVYGLKADGDGFLAVRSGPGSEFKKLDEVHNGDRVWIFENTSKWHGVFYGVDEVDCSPIEKNRLLDKPGKKGWVHENWIRPLAG